MHWILEIRQPALTLLFKALTLLGETGTFIVLLSIGYWLLRPGVFRRATWVLLITGLANGSLKEFFHVPRPQLAPLVEAAGWSFPSGHSQAAFALWPWLALEARNLSSQTARVGVWFLSIALLLAGAIAFSRVYLGVHTLFDVSIGGLIGLSTTALFWSVRAQLSNLFERCDPHSRALSAGAAVMLLWGVLPGAGANALPAGALLGFSIASIYERHFLAFRPPQSTLHRVLTGILGLAAVFALRLLLKALFAATFLTPIWSIFLRYAMIGLTVGAVIPYAMVRLGWSEREVPDS